MKSTIPLSKQAAILRRSMATFLYSIRFALVALLLSSFLSSCSNYRHRQTSSYETAQKVIERKSRSEKSEFVYFAHYNQGTYPLRNVSFTLQNDSSFVSGTLDSLDQAYAKTYDFMKHINQSVPKKYLQYMNQVHFTLKDGDSSLFQNSKILSRHEVIDTEIYYKSAPGWVLPVSLFGGFGIGIGIAAIAIVSNI